MAKVAIVSDSTGCIPAETVKALDIYVNYISVVFGTESYREFIDMSPEEFLERSANYNGLPTTSQPSPGQTIALYESLFEQGYEDIIHINISSQLSGSHQTALTCAEMVNPEHIHVFDSRTVTYTQGMFAVYAAMKAKEGASAQEILEYLEMIRENNQFYAAINDLTNLRKGGRLSNVEAALGSLLQIKPICQIQPDGTFQAVEKIRTFKKALKRLIEISKEAQLTEDYQLVVMHIGNEEAAKTVQTELQEIYPNHEINIYSISLVVAVHGGPGAVAVGWVKHK
ncbi:MULTISPECIES: DegV family protein [Turicibacter]|jgi:EDD domain protein, degV family|uniref:DegV family EDD domain-containing protein n=2 Tax=Turicibacter sanguinis TaxID=154288 RepID=A0A173RE02_9FIRM|nr:MULTISPECIES: DegV family protein [Turicibacter]EFF63835.1 EDD domain protein, DegV family [Turicibacter sanguinis PC909]EGC93464.1 EDD domain protein, DegV family [Turicibacter sp. HGF1]MBP3905145.1 DegV family protein [Turicibacter sp.]MCU7191528.1 DegV family protein [Turicibacter sanguinis]MCU7195440.1 DegV family protein [Turicibacter sanguinis]